MEPEQTRPAKEERRGRDATPASWPQRLWRRSAEVGREIVSLASGLVAVLTLALVAAILVESLVEKSVTIRPLSVPAALGDDGLSPEVVALSLRDGLNAYIDDVRRGRGWDATEIMDPEELPDVAVPSVGLSAQALAADVEAFFKIQNRTVVSGEIVSRGDSYALTLRLNGRPFFRSSRWLPRDRLDDMVREGALATLRQTQPVFAAAVALDSGDSQQTLMICDGIIARGRDPQDEHARILRAWALSGLGRFPEAIAEDRTTVALYPKDAIPRRNLGLLLDGRSRHDEAAAEFRAAIALDPRLPSAHTGLAKALLAMGQTGEAMKEFDTGIALAPKLFWPHFMLANALRAIGRADDALAQYRIAAPLSPDRAGLHHALGDDFLALGQPKEAAAEDRKWVTLDPGSADAHRRLAVALDDLGRHDEAAAERDAAERDAAAHPAAPPPPPPAPVRQGGTAGSPDTAGRPAP